MKQETTNQSLELHIGKSGAGKTSALRQYIFKEKCKYLKEYLNVIVFTPRPYEWQMLNVTTINQDAFKPFMRSFEDVSNAIIIFDSLEFMCHADTSTKEQLKKFISHLSLSNKVYAVGICLTDLMDIVDMPKVDKYYYYYDMRYKQELSKPELLSYVKKRG